MRGFMQHFVFRVALPIAVKKQQKSEPHAQTEPLAALHNAINSYTFVRPNPNVFATSDTLNNNKGEETFFALSISFSS